MRKSSNDRPILVPVDFSTCSEKALLAGCELAECLNLPIIVLHVVHDPAQMPGYYQDLIKNKQLLKIEDVARGMFEKYLNSLVKRHSKVKLLKKVEMMLVSGVPVTRILQVSEKTNAAMVVMGSHGLTGLKHLMLGSKAEQVVRLCPVPVTIVKSS